MLAHVPAKSTSSTKRKAKEMEDDGEGKPKKKRQPRKARDPNEPKRPASAYILFQNDIRGYTAKRSFPYAAVQAAIQAGKPVDFFRPVLCLLRTTDSANNPMSLDRMRASAAHEFGHALGIEGHSTNPGDLMSIYYGHGVVSANDAATIRYLYHLRPDLIP